MNGIESITQRILDEARQRAAQLLKEANESATRLEAEGLEKAEAEVAAIAKAGQARANDITDKAGLNAGIEARKIIAGRKQTLIGEAFDRALDSLLTMPEGEYQALLAGLAAEAAADGLGGQLLLSARDRAAHGKAVLKQANSLIEGESLSLADDSADIQGGVVIRRGKVEINCALEVIIRMLREEISGQVAACLFGKGA